MLNTMNTGLVLPVMLLKPRMNVTFYINCKLFTYRVH